MTQLDGLDDAALARLTGSPRVVLRHQVTSTLDLAHELAAAGAPQGTLVLAGEQTAGRGRQGRAWASPPGGLWMAVVLRPALAPAGGALAIRIGLALVESLGSLDTPISARLKWPNDLMVRDRKAGGVLCETRWRGDVLEWVAAGIGINVAGPVAGAVAGHALALDDVAQVTRPALLERIVPRVAALAARPPELTDDECSRFAAVAWPAPGDDIAGIAPDGALLLKGRDGSVTRRTTL